MAQIIVAFDNPTIDNLKDIHDEIGDTGVIYKFGLEFAEAKGPQGIAAIGIPDEQIFIDHKWADISNTVEGATRSALAHFKPLLVNVYSLAGRTAVASFATAVRSVSQSTSALAVTALTSWSDNECREITCRSLEGYSNDSAEMAYKAGCHGVVCHTRSVPALRDKYGPQFVIVTPGIRFPTDAVNDQHDPAHPTAAAKAGSNFLVVGRPILNPAKGTRRDAAMRFIEAATV